MGKLLIKIKINHSVRKLFHLQVGYNLNFAMTAKALYIGQWIWSQKKFTGIKGRKKGWSETCRLIFHVKK